MNDYKKMGGRVTTGSDSGFIYQTYGFGYINELEMLQEAGFHPLEVIQAATMNGALTLDEPKGQAPEFGIVRAGMLADMVIVDQNPLQNFKVLYGNGALRLNDKTGKPEQVGGVKYTIKDGIVYDAKQLLADVAAMVEKQKRSRAAKTTNGSAIGRCTALILLLLLGCGAVAAAQRSPFALEGQISGPRLLSRRFLNGWRHSGKHDDAGARQAGGRIRQTAIGHQTRISKP